MKIGIQTILWGRRIDDFETVLRTIAEEGFAGIEIAQRPFSEELGGIDSADTLNQLLRHYDLQLFGLAGGTLQERFAFADKYFSDAYYYVDDWEPNDETTIRDRAKSGKPFKIAAHPHHLKQIQTLADAEDLRKKNEAIFVLPDTAHLKIAGIDASEILKLGHQIIAAVHIKDWSREYGRSSHRYAKGFVELGQGDVGMDSFIKLCMETKFPCPLIFEQDRSRFSPPDCLATNAKWLRDLDVPLTKRPLPKRLLPPREITERPKYFDIKLTAQFYKTVFNASQKGLQSFFTEIVDGLCAMTGCAFASIWACGAINKGLNLIAVSPRNAASNKLKPHVSFKRSLCKDSLKGQKIEVISLDRYKNRHFENEEFYSSEKISHIISVPIFNSSNSNHVHYMAKLYYAQDAAIKWEKLEAPMLEELYDASAAISVGSDKALDDLCASTCGKVQILASRNDTVLTYSTKLVGFLKSILDCETVCLYLVDEVENKMVYVREDKSIATENDQSKSVFSRDQESLLSYVWRSKRILLTPNAYEEQGMFCPTMGIDHGFNRAECAIAPILNSQNEVLGVVECVNKNLKPGQAAGCLFCDDDAAILETTLQSAGTRLELIVKHHQTMTVMGDFERKMLEPLVSIRDQKDSPSARSHAKMAACYMMGMLSSATHRVSPTIVAPKATPQAIDLLRDIINPAISQCEYALKEGDTKWTTKECFQRPETMPLVFLPATPFIVIFWNIFMNAIAFRKQDARPEITINASYKTSTGLKVTVIDNGIGFDDQIVADLFSRKIRGANIPSRCCNGDGSGLLLCKHILDQYKGGIGVKEGTLKTEIYVTLPIDYVEVKQQPKLI